MNNRNEIKLNGYRIFPFQGRKGFLDFLKKNNFNNILIALNAEKIIQSDDSLRDIVNHNIGYPDGIGAVYALKRKGIQSTKIPGSEFWLDIINEFHSEKSFYFVGSKENVIKETVSKLRENYPNIEIKGFRDGYFNHSEFRELLQDIEKKEPEIVFVALGSPKQEYVMNQMNENHQALYMGLGGSFDVYSGHVKRAPKILIDLNLEWAYRLIKQPKRIFRQLHLVKYAFMLLLNRI